MKKFTIKLVGGTCITIWAPSLKQAMEKAMEDHPSATIVSVTDNSAFNEININITDNEQ